jgi:hypothetical protein
MNISKTNFDFLSKEPVSETNIQAFKNVLDRLRMQLGIHVQNVTGHSRTKSHGTF